MQANIRQRMVGAFVLICLSAIFWPVLFSGEINPSIDRSTRIPVAPKFEKFTVQKPQKPINIEDIVKYQPEEVDSAKVASSQTVQSPAAAKAVSRDKKAIKKQAENIQKPTFTEQGLPVYWALQLGSFSQKVKAEALKHALLAKGYKVDTRSVKTASGNSIRVYVGPKLDKSILLRAKGVIDKEFKVQSMLVRFSPR
ncbi:MAG: DedD protein [Pseudohongiellaceae bacterium]|jgi:DedD protein